LGFNNRIVTIIVLHRGSIADEKISIENRFAWEVNMISHVKHENLDKIGVLFLCVLIYNLFIVSILLL
jgi:hypothetical protein